MLSKDRLKFEANKDLRELSMLNGKVAKSRQAVITRCWANAV